MNSSIYPFPCFICGKRFAFPSEVGKHVEDEHLHDSPSMCETCGKVFKTVHGLARHRRTHTGETPYKCSFCSEAFAQWSQWRNHEHTHMKAKPFQCNNCQVYFDEVKDLEEHAKDCKGQNFFCCGETFSKREDFVAHQTKRHRRKETKLHNCQYCDRTFTIYTAKRIHEKNHKDRINGIPGPTMQCNTCNKTIPRSGQTYHKRNCGKIVAVKSSGGQGYSCDLCSNKFVNRREMYIHRKTHPNAASAFPCATCGKVLKSKASRYIHSLLHSGKKPHKCPHCDKAFTQRSQLKSHIRFHTKEKPFKCQYCGKAFAHRLTLQCHEKTHTGEKPYQCQFCKKGFIRPATLQNHERLHTGEKPHKCTVCGKSFTQQSTWASHIKTHKKSEETIQGGAAAVGPCDPSNLRFQGPAYAEKTKRPYQDGVPDDWIYEVPGGSSSLGAMSSHSNQSSVISVQSSHSTISGQSPQEGSCQVSQLHPAHLSITHGIQPSPQQHNSHGVVHHEHVYTMQGLVNHWGMPMHPM